MVVLFMMVILMIMSIWVEPTKRFIYYLKQLKMLNNLTEQQLKQIKYHLIGTITPENKREVNKQLRKIDRAIKKLLTNKQV